MDKLAATLDHSGNGKSVAMNVQAPQRGVGGVKFTYATGARPLDGYTIKRGVGIGGFGEVYYAVSDGGKEVAIKRIQRNLDVELRGVSQCLNLKHPNLLGLFDIRYDEQGQAWVIMEFVNGENLKDVIDRNPHGMPMDHVNRWFSEIARGVKYLHDHGIVHRDLKPGNIFMDHNIVKIGDYGLAKFISCSRRSGHTESVGTFHYMAPEIGKGVYGKEIDIYALGIILYEMLTGRVPFDGESSQEIIMKHLTADPDLSMLQRPYRQAIQRALFKDPSKRYSTVGELLQDLGLSRQEQSVQPRFASTPEIAFLPNSAGGPSGGTEEMVFGPVKSQPNGPQPLTPPIANAAQQALNEPILKTVQSGVVTLKRTWANSQISAPLRVVILVLGVLTLVFNAEWLLPLTLFLGAAYLVYFGARTLLFAMGVLPTENPIAPAHSGTRPVVQLSPDRAPYAVRTNQIRDAEIVESDSQPVLAMQAVVPTQQVAAQPVTSASSVPSARTGRRAVTAKQRKVNWRSSARNVLRMRSFSERSSELTGGMLLSALAACVLALIGMSIGGRSLNASVHTWSFFAWLSLTSIAGTWFVLMVSKFWETTDRDDDVRRRFVMLLAGLVLGATAFSLRDFLGVHLQDSVVLKTSRHTLVHLYEPNGTPKLPAFLLFFGAMFTLVRWWKQADPVRESRLSLWSTGVCVLLARIIHEFTPFYQPWGLITVGVISLAVQFSAPWISTAERNCLRQKAADEANVV